MTLTLKREFFIPKAELNARKSELGSAVVYCWEEKGRILAKGFRGKTNKPTFYIAFRNEAERNTHVAKFLADTQLSDQSKSERKARAKAEKANLNAKTDLPEGTILVQSWGWEQTNVNFFKVVGHFGRVGVLLVEVGAKRSEKEFSGNGMADYCEADLNAVGTEVTKVRQSGKTSIAVPGTGSYSWGSNAKVWDGKPCYRSWYA